MKISRTYKLDGEVVKLLEEHSKKVERSMTQIIERAIRAYCKISADKEAA